MKQTNKSLTTVFFLAFCLANSQAQWTQMVSGTTYALYDINFPTHDTGYAVGYYGAILKSTDAGITWTTLVSNTYSDLQGVEFLNANTGFVVGDSGIIKTTDGGITWNQISIPVASSLKDIEFINAQTGFCVGNNGTILKTTDGGNTWIIIPPPSGQINFNCVNFPTDSIGYIVSGPANWEFKKTIDGGNTWSNIPINPNNNYSVLEAIFFTDANTGYLGGWYFPAFYKTTDGGNNWVDKNIPDSVGNLVNPYSIYFTSSAIGYAVGFNNAVGIIKTSDAGNTWSVQNAGVSLNEIFYAVHFTNDTTGYIVGTNGIILKNNKRRGDRH